MSAHLITIQDPAGLIVTVVAFVVIGLAIWLDPDSDEDLFPDEAELKRCRVCGARIRLVDGEWEHHGDAHLVALSSMPHIPEPLTARQR